MRATVPITSFGDVDERSMEQLKRSIGDEGVAGVLCADHHPGYSMPIGGVVAYPEHISPSGVGFDIACGNKAARTSLRVEDVRPYVSDMMDEIERRVSFGMGRVNNEPADHPVLDAIRDAEYPFQRSLLDLAAKQLGTVGSGNHYVDLLEDERGDLWIGVHFGSRGFGHKTATHFMELAGRKDDGMDAPPILFSTDSELGQGYVSAMGIAGEYAYAGRDTVVDKVLSILGASAVETVHCHHNFAWRETHAGIGDVWVVRKGATPARPGELNFVGGSMLDHSVILEGTDECETALFSTAHGAGRVMSRTEAAGKVKRRRVWQCGNRDCGGSIPYRDLKQNEPKPKCEKCGAKMSKWRKEEVVKAGRVDWPSWQERLRSENVELRGGGADEAPEVYKNLRTVLGAHGDTIRVKHWLWPIGVAMAGKDVFDPYKD